MLELKNFSGDLARGELFLRAKCALINTHRLSIHIKHTRARGCDVTGYYRSDDRRLVAAVRPGLKYPVKAAYSVGYAPKKDGRSGLGRQKIWYEDRFESPDDLLVFVAGHEIWHFLCDSRQRAASHDEEALANRLGFLWLREFKRWRGSGARVAPIPAEPMRPDLVYASTGRGRTWRHTLPFGARRRATRDSSRSLRTGKAAASRRSTRSGRRHRS